jgi:iron complex outermembrane receptor protein
MTRKSPALARWAARSAIAILILSGALPAWSQEDPAAPEATESAAPAAEATAPAPEAVAPETPPAEAAPVEAAAPADEAVAAETPDVIPVDSGETQAPAGATKLDTVEVTGSRLRRTDYESAQPVFVMSRDDIERTGLTDISEILRNITAAGNNSLSAQQGRFALTMGETNLDLRNLGATHTLLLVNGRRWVSGHIQTQTSVSDYNTIPTAIIERIEVLKDGASAVYGSDAIGGVVNVITRQDFTGGAVDYNFGQFYEQGDGTNQQASFSYGWMRPSGNLFVNLSYTNQAEAPNENRPFTASPNVGPTRNSIVTPNALLRFVELDSTHAATYRCPNLQAGIAAGAAEEDTTGGPVAMTAIVPAGLVLCDLTLNPGATGADKATAPNEYHQIQRTNPSDVYNRFADGTLKEPNERMALYSQFSQDLGDLSDMLEGIRFNLDGLYNVRKSQSVGQNAYLGGGNLDGGAKGYLAYISAGNPNNPLGQEIGFDSSCGGLGDAGTNPASPSCTGVGDGSGSWAIRRAPGLNNQTFEDTVHTVRLGGGFGGAFEIFGGAMNWDAGYIYGRSKIEEILESVNYAKAGKALGAAGTTCVEAEDGCVPLNVFQGAAGLTQAATDYVLDEAWQRNRTQQQIAYLDLSTEIPVGSWLPAPIAVAIGAEYRRDKFSSAIDPIINQGLIRLNTLNALDGSTQAREAYAELGIPLLENVPAAQALELSLAGRISNYPRIGQVRTGKMGLRWQPTQALLLRGTYSTGFRAPNVGELYLGSAQSFDPLADPCADTEQSRGTTDNCTKDGAPGGGQGGNVTTPYDLWQGNRDLQPERSRNLTYGLIYSPLPDLSYSIDVYDIKIDDYVVIGQGQYFLDTCYKTPREATAAPKSGPNCEYIHRDGSGSLQYIDTPYFNLARVETAGVDLGMSWGLPLPEAAGRFKLALDATYLQKYDYQASELDPVVSTVGTVSGQFAGYPRWKAGGYLSWVGDSFKASWATRMAYRMTEPCGDFFPTPSLKDLGLCSDPDRVEVVDGEVVDAPRNQLHTVFYHNVQVGYELAQYGAEITLGVNNVLDQDPQVSRSLTSLYWYNFDPNHYEVPGRYGYLKASYKF